MFFNGCEVGVYRVPGEGAANAEIQFLTCVHRQGFIAVGFTQAVHGTPDVSVSDGTEFSTKHGLLPGIGPVHHWLNSVQNLEDERRRGERGTTRLRWEDLTHRLQMHELQTIKADFLLLLSISN